MPNNSRTNVNGILMTRVLSKSNQLAEEMTKGAASLLALVALASGQVEYKPSACEACEIALEEGLEKCVRLLKGQDSKVNPKADSVELHLEFPAMAEDMDIWRKYSAVHYANLFTNYLDKHTVKEHWKSVEMKFSGTFGASSLLKRDRVQEKRAPGSLGWNTLWGIRENECVTLSKFCKGSRLRVPRRALTPCGTCRETIRDTLIEVRRLWDTPRKVTIGSLDTVLESTCAKIPAHHSPKRAKYLEESCNELMIEEHGDGLARKVHGALQAAEPSWAKLGPSGRFSNDVEVAICAAELGLCGKDEL